MYFAQKNPAKTVVGIVCEYNPFHSGHAWMIEQLRRQGAEAVVCVMSGPFVQRAEAAYLPTYLRARAAVAGGADLVFRLPVAWAVASAEGFAYAAVGLLAALGCVQGLAFGAETADTGRLWQVAEGLEEEGFKQALQEELKKGVSFAAARAAAVEASRPGAGQLLREPNNILAIEYCKALQRGFSFGEKHLRAEDLPSPLAMPRKGAGHDRPPEEGIASASWLRKLARTDGAEALSPYVPIACQAVYRQAAGEGRWLDEHRYELAMLSRLRGMSPERFKEQPGAGEGLENRLAVAANRAVHLAELYDMAKTKRYAHSRIRRLALAAALGLPPKVQRVPPFLHLLAASDKGLSLLKKSKQGCMLPLSTSLARLGREGDAARQAALLEAKAEDFFALCLQSPQPGGEAFTRPVQIVSRK
ncbi:nucleotidyltransferase family protein [Ruminococcaceae bacterium OttesenSCG-928-I18]|nr:nucleotidyltransferase family protein [Ruminococcaceae bacterium OttesenSCG-928-I18]